MVSYSKVKVAVELLALADRIKEGLPKDEIINKLRYIVGRM